MNLLNENISNRAVVLLICVAIVVLIRLIAWAVDLLEERYREYEKKRRNNRIGKYEGWRMSNRERSAIKSNQRRQKGKEGKT